MTIPLCYVTPLSNFFHLGKSGDDDVDLMSPQQKRTRTDQMGLMYPTIMPGMAPPMVMPGMAPVIPGMGPPGME